MPLLPKHTKKDLATRDKYGVNFTDLLLMKTVKELFIKLYERRLLIRLVGVRFTNLVSGTYQIDLFEDKQDMIKLYQSIDSIKKRYGEAFLVQGQIQVY